MFGCWLICWWVLKEAPLTINESLAFLKKIFSTNRTGFSQTGGFKRPNDSPNSPPKIAVAQELRDQQGKTSSECPGDVMSFGVAMVFWPTFKVSGMTYGMTRWAMSEPG